MRELILKMFMSLDGFVGSTDGDPSWMINPDPVAKAWGIERAWDTSLHVVGSRTFQDVGRLLADLDRRVRRPDEPDSQGRLFQTGTGDPRSGRAVQDKPGALQPGAESWAQAYVASGDLVEEVTG